MTNLTFDDKITKLLTEMVGDYWEHMTCSDECGKKTMETENLKDYIAQIKQLIAEVIGEIEIVHFDDANSADLRFRDGANERLGRNKLRRQLRHAFNLKGNIYDKNT